MNETPNVMKERTEVSQVCSTGVNHKGNFMPPSNQMSWRSSRHTLSIWVFKCLDAEETYEFFCPECSLAFFIKLMQHPSKDYSAFPSCCQFCRIDKDQLGQKDLSSDLQGQCSSQEKYLNHYFCKKRCFHTCVLLSI